MKCSLNLDFRSKIIIESKNFIRFTKYLVEIHKSVTNAVTDLQTSIYIYSRI